jgi:amino acid adenylation domain-containing protein
VSLLPGAGWYSAGNAVPLDSDGPVEVAFEEFEHAWIERPIFEHFERSALRHADRCAVADGTQKLSYGELHRRARALATLIAGSVPRGCPVGILLPHNAVFPVAALACLAAGRPYVPIDLKFPAARIDMIVREAGLAAVIVEAAADAALLPPGVAVIELGAASTVQAPEAPLTPSDEAPAVILYTSGSTGKPKGICNDQRAILQRVAEATNSCHLHADDRFILLSSPGTIAGVREMFAALLNGATLHITDPQRDGIQAVLRTMETCRVTVAYAVPSLLRTLLRLPGAGAAFAHLRILRIGGDITLDSDLRLFRRVAPPTCRFFASFSSTETPAVFQWFVPPDWQPAGPRIPIGHPRPGIDFAVVDDDGRAVAPGETGELVVRSRYLAAGHWQDGRLQPGPFLRDPDDPSLRILRTGDMVKLRGDGLWELIGRKDRQVKIRGLRIDVGEVEAALRSCEDVADVAVIARRQGEEVSALTAFVAPRDPDLLPALKRALHERVPQYMHPADIRLLDAIPQLPGFKPDIVTLEKLDRQEVERERAQSARTAPRAPVADAAGSAQEARIRAAVRHAWSAVLGAESFEADRAWNETNGDSLKAMELWFYIEDRLGFKLPLDSMDEHTRPSGLIAAIQKHLDGKPSQDGAADGAPVVFLMPGILSDDPALVRFRAAFGKRVRFRMLDYPAWRQSLADRNVFGMIAASVFEQICSEPPQEVYRLAGYSFGGVIAFEVAHRLLASGRKVGFLGLLDSRRWDLVKSNVASDFGVAAGRPKRLPVETVKTTIATLNRWRWFAPLGLMERVMAQRPSRAAFWYKRELTRSLRFQALRQWKPAPLDVPTLLFLSDERWPGEPEDYGWDSVCSQLKKIHIGGNHGTVIQPPYRETLCSHFMQAL